MMMVFVCLCVFAAGVHGRVRERRFVGGEGGDFEADAHDADGEALHDRKGHSVVPFGSEGGRGVVHLFNKSANSASGCVLFILVGRRR